MNDLLAQLFTAATLAVILAKVTPILLAALGGALTQQANVLNIGLEGMMLLGAFASISVGITTGNSFIGLVAGVLAAALLALIFAIIVLHFHADEIVVGIGVNLLAVGLTVFLLVTLYGNAGVTPPDKTITLPKISLGPLAEIPVLGPTLNDQTVLVWLAFAAVPLCSFLLYRTRFGVHLRAAGEDQAAAQAAGVRVLRVKFMSVLLSGVFCGLAGSQLAMATIGAFSADMTAGRGFIAVAALTFGLARPVRTMVAATIFGAADALSDLLGIAGINSNIALMMPYIITIVALVFSGLRIRSLLRGNAQSQKMRPS
ncbi:ABC transporter permease [Lysinibacter sp. HNR]|uniref:ABC transporter permease n=1 Tax=Lysinibacter sp. HNR TaxID=3031408 RepID=UPI002435137C|nr:ABC transporter permease [Lysinibacter sp. HNR]WGD38268.1 ABC transporter permease [Lysinibacter sp. HNR]